MTEHKNYVEGFDGELTDLVDKIGSMSHDARQEFFANFANYVNNQAERDEEAKRLKYAKILREIALKLTEVEVLEGECWDICEPYTIVVDRENEQELSKGKKCLDLE